MPGRLQESLVDGKIINSSARLRSGHRQLWERSGCSMRGHPALNSPLTTSFPVYGEADATEQLVFIPPAAPLLSTTVSSHLASHLTPGRAGDKRQGLHPEARPAGWAESHSQLWVNSEQQVLQRAPESN